MKVLTHFTTVLSMAHPQGWVNDKCTATFYSTTTGMHTVLEASFRKGILTYLFTMTNALFTYKARDGMNAMTSWQQRMDLQKVEHSTWTSFKYFPFTIYKNA